MGSPERQGFEALLYVSFGGPQGPEEVRPFLASVLRGRAVPAARVEEVLGRYLALGGVSPIHAQNQLVLDRLEPELRAHGVALPLHVANRHSRPFLADVLAALRADGVRRVLAFATSAYSGQSSCRAYLDAIEEARRAVGEGAPEVVKLAPFHAHPRFREAVAAELLAVLEAPDVGGSRSRLVFTAHSVPVAMPGREAYVAELCAASQDVAARVGHAEWDLAYQSRSGPPTVPWLEPDILDHLRALRARGVRRVTLSPIGFVSDHMEVVWDLDHDAAALAGTLGIELVRAGTAGRHPAFVTMIRELVVDALAQAVGATARRARWSRGACAPDCCR